MDMNPGPIDGSVLYDQDKHVSAAVWEGQERGALRCHEHTSKLGEWKLTPRQIALVEKAGFGYLRKIPAISLDNPLISALVERWRRETNTFHFTVGEMTVTLQDVALLLGLAIDGKPVIGLTHTTCGLVCERLLGRAPDSNYASGGMVKLSWLKEFFSHCPEDALTEEVERCTRAYLLYLVGSTIFSTTTGNKVPVMYLPLFDDFEECGKYAWGAAALAFLYRALGNACVKSQSTICGCLTLLQCWSYFHLNIGRPKLNRDPIHDHFPFVLRWKGKQSGPTTNRDVVFYRKALDLLKPSDVEWLPYKYMDSTVIPEDINCTLILGKSKTMLICFDKAERHLPDRCLRQYGMIQPIPEDVVRWVRKSRGVDGGVDLSGKMEAELNEWMDRRVQIVQGDDGIDDETEYMQWYSKITRKVVGRPISLSSEFQRTISGLREIAYLADSFSTKGLDGQQFDSISRIRFIAQDCLRDQGGSPAITSPTLQIEHGKRTRGKERVRRKGTGKRRRKDDSLDYQEASEDEADEQPQFYGAVIGVDQLHIRQAEGEVGQLQLRLAEDEVDPQHLSMTGGVVDGTELLVVNKVDDMQLIEETGGVHYSQSNHATEEVDDSEMLEATTKEVEDSQNCAPHNEVTDSQTYLARMNEDYDSQPREVENNSNDLQPCNTKTSEVNNSHLQVASNEINDSQLPDASRMDCDSQPPGSKKEDNGLSLPDTTEKQNDSLLPATREENDSKVINELQSPDEIKETGNSQLPDTTKEAEHFDTSKEGEHFDETKETGNSQLSDTTKEGEHFDETKETGNSQLPDTTKEAEHFDTSKANHASDSTKEADGSQLPEEATETGQSEQPTVEAAKDDVPEVEAKPDDRKVAV